MIALGRLYLLVALQRLVKQSADAAVLAVPGETAGTRALEAKWSAPLHAARKHAPSTLPIEGPGGLGWPHQPCKENGPRAIWLIEFWCLMINTIRELISFSSVYVCSSQDARITWTKELRKATPQKKTLRRSRKVQKRRRVLPTDYLCVEHQTVRYPHTGLSGAP
jgi:hypothetical protein